MLDKNIIDEIDAKILQHLMRNSREKITDIAAKVSASRPTVYDRIDQMEKKGIIEGYTTTLNFKKSGLPLTTFILVSFDAGAVSDESANQKNVAQRISEIKYVRKVNIVTGTYDFLVTISIDDMGSLADVIIEEISDIPGVGNTVTMTSFAEYTDGRRVDKS